MADLFTCSAASAQASVGESAHPWRSRRRWRAAPLGVLIGLLGVSVSAPVPVSAGAPVHITAVSPNADTNAGGVTVNITGSGFLASSQVKICNAATGTVTFTDSAHISIVAPATSSYGACLVEVDNIDGGRSPELVAFNYYEGMPLSAGTASAATAATHELPGPNDAQVDVFVRGGTDDNLHHDWHTNLLPTWQEENLGGTLTSAPTAVSWGSDRLDVFAKGTDNALWHKWWGGGPWSGWESLGGDLVSNSAPSSPLGGFGPVVTSWAPGRLDVFARGTDSQLWHRFYAGGWSSWEPLGGVLASSPGGVSWGPNRIDVFCRGTDTAGAVWHKWWDGATWNGWESLSAGGTISQGPAATSRGPGDLEVYVLGYPVIDLLHLSYSGGWASRAEGQYWASSTPWGFSPAATSQSFVIGPEVFMLGGNRTLWHGVTFGPRVGFPSSRPRNPSKPRH